MANEKESAFKSIVTPVLVLVVICVVCSALLAWLNGVTKPIIAENEHKQTQAAYLAVLPVGTNADTLQDVAVTADGVLGAVKSADGSVAIKAAAPGYSGKALTVYVAFDQNGIVTNIKADASLQTTGIGSKTGAETYTAGFIGWDATAEVALGNPVDGIAGATVSSKALVAAMNKAINCYDSEIRGVA